MKSTRRHQLLLKWEATWVLCAKICCRFPQDVQNVSVTMVYVLLQMGYASHQFLPHTKSIGRLQLAGSLPKDSFCSNIAFIKNIVLNRIEMFKHD